MYAEFPLIRLIDKSELIHSLPILSDRHKLGDLCLFTVISLEIVPKKLLIPSYR